tara:strand:- start:4001 stop:5659 length:1659 start_codon:yes stop_codon:yes gene_type:complete
LEDAGIKRTPRRLAHRLLIAAIVLLVVVCAGLFALWQSRLGLATRIVADALASRGISNASFHISALGFKSIEVEDLVIASEADRATQQSDIAARRISVIYNFGELLSGRVQSIDIDGLRVKARLGDHGLSLGAGDPLLRQGGTGSAAAALPAIHVTDAAIRLITTQGTFEASGDGEISQAGATAPIVVTLPALRLNDADAPARFTPVMLSTRLQLDDKLLTFDADARTAPANGKGVALTKIAGQYDMAKATASAKASGQLAFAPGKLEPRHLSPALNGLVRDLSGDVSYTADFAFAKSKLTSSGKATLKGIGFSAGPTVVSGVAGTVKLSSLLPPRTSGVQTLTVAHVETAVPLDKGVVKFAVGSAMAVQLVEATWPFTGGRLTLTVPKGSSERYNLAVDNVDIAKLLVMVDVPGLSGTGKLSGQIPLKIVDGDPIVTNGALSANGSGTIIYKSEAADAAVNTEQTQLLSDALKDFHYTELSGALDGNINGNLKFHIGLRGANPSLYDGYPINLNVNLEGSLVDIVRRGTVGLRPLELIQSGVGKEKEARPE